MRYGVSFVSQESALCLTIVITMLHGISGPWFNIKMSSDQYGKSHCWDKTVVRSFYLHNGISYPGKMSSLYWIWAQVIILRVEGITCQSAYNLLQPFCSIFLILITDHTLVWVSPCQPGFYVLHTEFYENANLPVNIPLLASARQEGCRLFSSVIYCDQILVFIKLQVIIPLKYSAWILNNVQSDK